MKRRSLKFLLALLLGWYVLGPLVETVDFWDDLRAELSDIARSAGGSVTLVVAWAAFTIILLRKLRERCSSLAMAIQGRFQSLPFRMFLPFAATVAALSHSPPSPLRI